MICCSGKLSLSYFKFTHKQRWLQITTSNRDILEFTKTTKIIKATTMILSSTSIQQQQPTLKKQNGSLIYRRHFLSSSSSSEIIRKIDGYTKEQYKNSHFGRFSLEYGFFKFQCFDHNIIFWTNIFDNAKSMATEINEVHVWSKVDDQ